jgi:ketosteroid isomerase-like protein
MKKSAFLILPVMIPFIFLTSCKHKVDLEKEKEAIKAVIYNETQAYLQKDTAKIFSYYVRDSFQTRLTVNCDTFTVRKGWNEVSALFLNSYNTSISNPKNSKEFLQIKVIGDAAWVMYIDNWNYDLNGSLVAGKLLNTMILEKKENEWKISGFSLSPLKK